MLKMNIVAFDDGSLKDRIRRRTENEAERTNDASASDLDPSASDFLGRGVLVQLDVDVPGVQQAADREHPFRPEPLRSAISLDSQAAAQADVSGLESAAHLDIPRSRQLADLGIPSDDRLPGQLHRSGAQSFRDPVAYEPDAPRAETALDVVRADASHLAACDAAAHDGIADDPDLIVAASQRRGGSRQLQISLVRACRILIHGQSLLSALQPGITFHNGAIRQLEALLVFHQADLAARSDADDCAAHHSGRRVLQVDMIAFDDLRGETILQRHRQQLQPP
ncbi:hypothetical protein BN871_HF_00050 [Paenibacillus sp. P22]|nr:hypothetical protein BN871_HF_00050 [Paenibacillus sp. P22]